jgi:hypothetical protein
VRSRRGPDHPSRGLADRVRFRRIRFNGTRCNRTWRTHDGDLGDHDAGSTTGLDVHDVGTAGVAACDAPGLRVKQAEVGEAAECLGDGVLAKVERGAEVADVRLDGEAVGPDLGSEGKFFEEHPSQRSDPSAQGTR